MGPSTGYDHTISPASPSVDGSSWQHGVDELLAPLDAPGPVPTVSAVSSTSGGGAPSASEQAYGDAPGHRTLRFGAQGDAVVDLQMRLNAGGDSLAVDGVFGAKTRAAVIRFQTARGLAPDGVVGRNTWGALDAVELVDSDAPDRVLETLDRNGDTSADTSTDALGGGNLLGAPPVAATRDGQRTGVSPAEFKKGIDRPGVESAADLGQRLWGHAIGAAVRDEATAILHGASAQIVAGFTEVVAAIGKIDSHGGGVATAIKKATALVKKIQAAKSLSPAQIASLVKLASPNGPDGPTAFRALWRGYDTSADPHMVPPQYRSLGAGIAVKKHEAQACAEVTGIGAQRYLKHHKPHGKPALGDGKLASEALRISERDSLKAQEKDKADTECMLGDVVQYTKNLEAVRSRIQETLAAGYFVQAHVVSGSCVGGEGEVWDKPAVKGTPVAARGEHWLLIIGFDGEAFDAWNPSGAGGSFRKLHCYGNHFSTAASFHDFHVRRGGTQLEDRGHRYQVVTVNVIGAAGGAAKPAKTAALDGGDDAGIDHQIDGGQDPAHAVA
jgi:peptidoglycan hydrolase-like protein with peptidoglycan-binding domain